MFCSPGGGKGASPRLCLATAMPFPHFPPDKRTGRSSRTPVLIAGSSSALHRSAGGWGHRSLPGLSPREPHVQVVEDGRCLVAHSDPVLVYQVAGGHVSVGRSEGLLQRVPFERGHDVLPCKGTGISHWQSLASSWAQPRRGTAQVTVLHTSSPQLSEPCHESLDTLLSLLPWQLMTPSIAYLKPNPAPDITLADKNLLAKAPKHKGGKAGSSRSFKDMQFSFHLQQMLKKLVSANISLDHWKQTLIC